uniref:Carbohydrate sulfotransferase n=1 Tax=Anguilla anguilla TaxID=7936 RepID=A0A0E9VEE5_ANGAN
MDIHWETVNRLCFPCFITYDFIGKFETLEQDANYFLSLVGAPGDLRFPSFKRQAFNRRKNYSLSRQPLH